MTKKITHYFYALRPYQWIKNGFVFLPLIFGRKLTDPLSVWRTVAVFSLFCAAASAVYLLNDVIDLEADRLHPLKKLRPLAKGHLSPKPVTALAFILIASVLLSGLTLSRPVGLILFAYIAGNIFYSWALKKIVIVDVLMIGVFFLMRISAGAFAISVEMSEWLLICSTVLALFLGFNKRRHELLTMGRHAGSHRKVLEKYSLYFIDQILSILTASIVVFYTLYTVDSRTVAHFGTNRLLWTVPFVYYGIFRYLYLVHKHRQGGDPARIVWKDRMLKINLLLWMSVSIAVIYFKF